MRLHPRIVKFEDRVPLHLTQGYALDCRPSRPQLIRQFRRLLVNGFQSLDELAFGVALNEVAGWSIHETCCVPVGHPAYLGLGQAVQVNLSTGAALPEWRIQKPQSLRAPDMCFSAVS